ncbi:MAG: hypothetical protein JWN95_301 [Frankiales bacterium]|nr:hypothetical protein [Frankiales bacterium]
MTQNPNWPVMDYAVCWQAGPQQSPIQTNWTSILERIEGQVSSSRGKQYELDQVQPGEFSFTARNDDGALDPDNTASPYAGWVVPYRLFRARAQWPPTQNLLYADQAAAGLPSSFPAGSTLPYGVFQGSAYPVTLQHGGGFNFYNAAIPAAPVAGSALVGFNGWSCAAGVTYSVSCQMNGSTNAQAYMAILWYDVNAVFIGQSSGAVLTATAAAQTLTATSTAPAGAAIGTFYLFLANSPVATSGLSCWNVQLEKAASPTGYVQPSTWYPIYTGYIERFPQTWTSGGNYGRSALDAVDYFSNLAGHTLLPSFIADVLALNPRFFYPLSEGETATQFLDIAGNRGPMYLLSWGAAPPVPGGTVEATTSNPPGPDAGSALTGAFIGAPGPVVTQAPEGTGVLVVPPDPATGRVGPPAAGGWTRIIAARINSDVAPGVGASGPWMYLSDPSPFTATPNGAGFNLGLGPNAMRGFVSDAAGNSAASGFPFAGNLTNLTSGAMVDGDWHLYGISLDSSGNQFSTWLDSWPSPALNFITATHPAQSTPGVAVDIVAGGRPGDVWSVPWPGQVAFVIELAGVITGTQWAGLAQSWRNAWSSTSSRSERSSDRYQRILNWISWLGPARISPGSSTSYGPATDVDGANVLQALQNVVSSESGQHFIGADGAVVFQSRADRYTKTPVATFGEDVAGGEIPYLGAATDYDPTRIGNDVAVTAQYTGTSYRAADVASQDKYGTVALPLTVNSVDPLELANAADSLLYQNKDPQTRLESLPIDLAANPWAWGVVLGLELGTCVGWNRRPSNAPAMNINGFVEQIQWNLDDQGNAECDLQVTNGALKETFWKWDTSRWSPVAGQMVVNGTMTAVQATIGAARAAGSPPFTILPGSYPLTIEVDDEQITLTAPPSGTTSPQAFAGIIRGVNGTTPAIHLSNAPISLAPVWRWAY